MQNCGVDDIELIFMQNSNESIVMGEKIHDIKMIISIIMPKSKMSGYEKTIKMHE